METDVIAQTMEVALCGGGMSRDHMRVPPCRRACRIFGIAELLSRLLFQSLWHRIHSTQQAL